MQSKPIIHNNLDKNLNKDIKPIQYIISDDAQIDIFFIDKTGEYYGWEFTALPTTSTSTATFKPNHPFLTDNLYGKLYLKKLDQNNKIIYDEKGHSILGDPNNNICTAILNNLQKYITNNKVDFSTVRLYDNNNSSYVYVDTTNPDIAQLIAELNIFKNELYATYTTTE
jgi:hypothetical protein